MSVDETTWTRLSSGTVSQRVEEQIELAIRSGRIQPGERLPPEREFAAMLGVSRPTVRQAIGTLKARGILRVVHGRGVFVAEPPTARELRSALASQQHTVSELFAMREVLEAPAASWAAERQDPATLHRVQTVLDELNTAMDETPRDFDRLQRLDASFHLAIVEAAGNKFLQQTVGVLQAILNEGMQTTLMIPGRIERSRADHQRILEALLAGRKKAARDAAVSHVRAARDSALLRLHEQSDDER